MSVFKFSLGVIFRGVEYINPGDMSCICYTELAISSLAMAVIIVSIHRTYSQRDGQAELIGWLDE